MRFSIERRRWTRWFLGSAAVVVAAAACAGDPSGGPAGSGGLFVVTTDFETGAFSILDPETSAATVNVGLLHSDATARVFDGRVYALNRLGMDNLTCLDPADGYRVVYQRSTGPGSNPQDVAVVSAERGYVTRLERPRLLVFDPRDGRDRGEVDLSPWADADGFPEASALVVAGDRVVAALGRLDRADLYRPAGNGALAVIDPAADRVERVVELTGANPFGDMVERDGVLWVAQAGRFGEFDGGIERFRVDGWVSEGWDVTEADLDGDVVGFARAPDGALWIVVQTASIDTRLVRLDSAGGSPRVLRSAPGYALTCVADAGAGRMAVCDRTPTAPGVRLFDAATSAETMTAPIDVGLPPWQVRVL